jgi:hypothetical protein
VLSDTRSVSLLCETWVILGSFGLWRYATTRVSPVLFRQKETGRRATGAVRFRHATRVALRSKNSACEIVAFTVSTL